MTNANANHTETIVSKPARSKGFIGRHFGVLSIALVFLILFVIFSVATDSFFSAENLVNVARQIAPTVIVAMAMTFVITTGQIDLSVGSIVGLSAATLGIWAVSGNGLVALILTLLMGLVVGLVSGGLTAYGRMQSFIVTLAALTALRGVALFLTEGYSTPIDSPFLIPIGQGKFLGLYTPTWIAVVVVALAWYVFNHTRFGRYVTATGSNSESLRRSGVDIRKIQMAVLGMTGFAAALAGVITASRLSSGSPNSGTMFELEVITAVVLGGTSLMGGRGSIMGSAIGALTLGILSNGLVLLRVDVYWIPIVQGLILVVAILVNTRLFSRFSRSGS
ncbi:ABC transporter permease [Leucobacter sp. USHLN153]|uniref:ABC transporter permease n=1 Tax=Leucobacter sp. USHLN153 TaxID=3081268 RepID=UPI003018B976